MPNKIPPSIGKVYGKILDASTKKGVEYATITVQRAMDSSNVTGGVSDGKGIYLIEKLMPGSYWLKVSFIGYTTTYSRQFSINRETQEVDMGVLELKISSKAIKEAEVIADKSLYENSIDKKIFNVEKDLVSTGGSATDVLKNIPSIQVDIDGKISLRGSENVTILIDGKPSGLSGPNKEAILAQLPASSIQHIEVITNPTAKYDVEGMGGIINIITKKDKRKGFNGMATVSTGTNGSFNPSLNFNYRTEKFNVFGNTGLRHDNRLSTGFVDQHYLLPTWKYSYHSTNSGQSLNNGMNLKAGLDWYISPYSTLSFSGAANKRTEDKEDFNDYAFSNNLDSVYRKYGTNSTTDEAGHNMDFNLDFTHTFNPEGRQISASANYSTDAREVALMQYSGLRSSNQNNVLFKEAKNSTNFFTTTQQTDYVHPFNKNFKLETGFKNTYRMHDGEQSTTLFTDSSSKIDSRYTDHFIYTQDVPAAYAMITSIHEKIDFNVGLRAEDDFTKGQSVTRGETNKTQLLSLFPSGYVRLKSGYGNEVKLSYGRRTNRPDSRAINPAIDNTDTLNLRSGNPYLKPEFISSYDVSVKKLMKSYSVSASVYYRHTTNMINRYRNVDTITGVGLVTMKNYLSADNLGLEGSFNYYLGKKGNITASGNLFKNKVDASNIESNINSEAFNWNVRLNAALRLSKTTSIQLNGNYMAPMTTPKSTMKGMSGIDIGFKQDLFKGKGSLGCNIGDILNTRSFLLHNEGLYYYTDMERKRQSRIATFTFSYRFGKGENTPAKKKENTSPTIENPGMDF